MGFKFTFKKALCHPRVIVLLMAPVLCLVASTGLAAEMDHSFLQEFNGAQTCEMCHAGKVAEVQETVHYKFESDVPEEYLYDEEGHPRTIERSGKARSSRPAAVATVISTRINPQHSISLWMSTATPFQ